MPQPPDAVIAASLQAACIRASAAIYGGTRETKPFASDVIDYAKEIYAEATTMPWLRGDEPSPEVKE